METISDRRRRRLRTLIDEVAEGNASDFGRKIDKDRRQISAWLRHADSAGAKNISDTSAREIEARFGKPRGWMDADGSVKLITPAAPKASQPLQQEREIVAAAVKLVRYIKERSVTPIPDEMESDLLFHAMRIVRDAAVDDAAGLDDAARQLAASIRNGG